MNLFDSAAPDYARYRPGIPDEAIQLLARTLEGIDRPTLLDLGSGTGQVTVGLLPALAQIGRVDLVDRDEDMLRTASELLRPRLGQSAVAYHAIAAEEFTAPYVGYRRSGHRLPGFPLDDPSSFPGDGRSRRHPGCDGRGHG
ncbi:class I SAM-dependent methyltransferase [Streptomyces sp. NBC_01363]|uniref:class I SAM-dependent methyltransferase n=1 Tax=Streptomyces sp. NBC_01363 TaxID=2903840 RepID=UPI002250962F|nr:class I SAM-dependent methyltransferase [Streptomyces sp. NBC_01363]MCX4736750.1 class I SAM-dependent methyltransferase [Streptomyces sp. NBC_01363]